MTIYSNMRVRERRRGAPVPRAFFMRDDGWTHAQHNYCPPSIVVALIGCCALATVYLLVRGPFLFLAQ